MIGLVEIDYKGDIHHLLRCEIGVNGRCLLFIN